MEYLANAEELAAKANIDLKLILEAGAAGVIDLFFPVGQGHRVYSQNIGGGHRARGLPYADMWAWYERTVQCTQSHEGVNYLRLESEFCTKISRNGSAVTVHSSSEALEVDFNEIKTRKIAVDLGYCPGLFHYLLLTYWVRASLYELICDQVCLESNENGCTQPEFLDDLDLFSFCMTQFKDDQSTIFHGGDSFSFRFELKHLIGTKFHDYKDIWVTVYEGGHISINPCDFIDLIPEDVALVLENGGVFNGDREIIDRLYTLKFWGPNEIIAISQCNPISIDALLTGNISVHDDKKIEKYLSQYNKSLHEKTIARYVGADKLSICLDKNASRMGVNEINKEAVFRYLNRQIIGLAAGSPSSEGVYRVCFLVSDHKDIDVCSKVGVKVYRKDIFMIPGQLHRLKYFKLSKNPDRKGIDRYLHDKKIKLHIVNNGYR